MLARVLEPEVMDTPDEAHEYDAMDHSAVNRVFAADFFAACPQPTGLVLDVAPAPPRFPSRWRPSTRPPASTPSTSPMKC